MKGIVLDASMALSWLLPDEAGDKTLEVRDALIQSENVWVASHWKLEVCNAICTAERRKRLDPSGVAQAISLIAQLPVIVDMETNLHVDCETLSLARQHSLSIYDAAYLELALRRGAGLATLDSALRSVAHGLGLAVIPTFD